MMRPLLAQRRCAASRRRLFDARCAESVQQQRAENGRAAADPGQRRGTRAVVGWRRQERGLHLRAGVVGSTVYAAARDGTIVRLDDGQPAWRIKAGKPLSGGVGADARMLVVGTAKGEVLAFSAFDGSPLWKAKASSEVVAPPALSSNGLVIVRTVDHRLAAYDASDGKRKWLYQRPSTPLSLRVTGATDRREVRLRRLSRRQTDGRQPRQRRAALGGNGRAAEGHHRTRSRRRRHQCAGDRRPDDLRRCLPGAHRLFRSRQRQPDLVARHLECCRRRRRQPLRLCLRRQGCGACTRQGEWRQSLEAGQALPAPTDRAAAAAQS
jgi:hypothetical protein